jgi:hypothetical protein
MKNWYWIICIILLIGNYSEAQIIVVKPISAIVVIPGLPLAMIVFTCGERG